MTEPSQYFKGRTVQEQMNEVIGYVDVRSAEVATNAIAADVAQVHQDMLDADADASAAAASAAAAAGTLANAVKKTGEASQSIAGDIAVAGDLSAGGDLGVTGAITGDDATFTGDVTVPTETTGQFTTKAANSTKIKNELDNYTPMMRTTGNQTVSGIKTIQSINARVSGYQIATFVATANKWYKLYEYIENSNFTLRLKGMEPNNNIGWIKVFIGGTARYTRSQVLEKVSRYSSTTIVTCTNTSTGKSEIYFSTGADVGGNVIIELVEGYMGSTFVEILEEAMNPNTDGIHTDINTFT